MQFKSRTIPGQVYRSTEKYCTCPGFASARNCWHVKSLKSKSMEDNSFLADDVQVKTFKGNKDEVEVIFRTGSYEWNKIKDFQMMRDKQLKITVEVVRL